MVGLFLFDFSANEFHFKADNNDTHDREMPAIVKDLLENEFGSVLIENQTDIKCQLDEGFSLKISLSSSHSKQRFLFLRKVIFENDFMLPLFYTILHFVRQDVKFIDVTFDPEWYLEFFVNFCIQNEFIKEPDMTTNYFYNDDHDFGDDSLNDW